MQVLVYDPPTSGSSSGSDVPLWLVHKSRTVDEADFDLGDELGEKVEGRLTRDPPRASSRRWAGAPSSRSRTRTAPKSSYGYASGVADASEDRVLMARLAAGDRDALEPLMGRHYKRVYRIALGYLRNPEDALDVVQETFVRAFEHAGRWDGAAEVAPWLARIAVNQSIDRYRRNKRRRASFSPLEEGDHQESLATPDVSPERRALSGQLGDRIAPRPRRACPRPSARSSSCATTRR